MPLRIFDGTLLLGPNGKLASDEACCCGPADCVPPEGVTYMEWLEFTLTVEFCGETYTLTYNPDDGYGGDLLSGGIVPNYDDGVYYFADPPVVQETPFIYIGDFAAGGGTGFETLSEAWPNDLANEDGCAAIGFTVALGIYAAVEGIATFTVFRGVGDASATIVGGLTASEPGDSDCVNDWTATFTMGVYNPAP